MVLTHLFTADRYGSLWVAADPTPTRLRKVMKEALNAHAPYAVELVRKDKRARDVRA